MKVSRRNFLKIGGATGLWLTFGSRKARTQITSRVENLKILNAKETRVICPFCSVGCGAIIHSQEGRMINIEGDSEHPINRGTLCPKGAGAIQLGGNSPTRILRPLYRAPFSTHWEEKSWEWCIERMARLIKKTRDETFERTNRRGQVVNRMQGFAFIGGSCNHNEECYAWLKLLRSWGAVNVDNHARICHSPTVPALAETFGRGAMTNHPIDIRNTDCSLILGSNMAENHPCAFPFVQQAMRERGAKLIVVDPRFNRTAAHATLFAEIRPGTDIAFVGGTLVPIGGHNLLEPASLGLPIVTGPHLFNTQDIANMFSELGAFVEVRNAAELAAALASLFRDGDEAEKMAGKGRQILAENRGALQRLLNLMEPLISKVEEG